MEELCNSCQRHLLEAFTHCRRGPGLRVQILNSFGFCCALSESSVCNPGVFYVEFMQLEAQKGSRLHELELKKLIHAETSFFTSISCSL